MTKFVLAYTGGSAPDTKEEQDAVMAAWMGWFGQLGAAVVDVQTASRRSTEGPLLGRPVSGDARRPILRVFRGVDLRQATGDDPPA